MKARLKKIGSVALRVFIILFLTLCLFELSYRFYWIDFYASELNALNPEQDLNREKQETILVFGDSFTADPSGWVQVLRDSVPNTNIINCAIPGTSICHQKLFFEDRIEAFQPDKIILQLYVGNDLIDYYRPVNFGEVSFSRNLYWWLSDRFMSLQYLNYKMGQFKSGNPQGDPKLLDQFNKESYNPRVLTYLKSDSSIVQNSIDLGNGYESVLFELLDDVEEMLTDITVPIYLLVVPHSVQIGTDYFDNYRALGASLDSTKIAEYAFLKSVHNFAATNLSITVLDPLKTLKEKDLETPVYFQNDPHLNSKGQHSMGVFVLNTIQ